MTKKDYIKLAEIIKKNSSEVLTPYDYETINRNNFLDNLCDMLTNDNPRFDREKFIRACK